MSPTVILTKTAPSSNVSTARLTPTGHPGSYTIYLRLMMNKDTVIAGKFNVRMRGTVGCGTCTSVIKVNPEQDLQLMYALPTPTSETSRRTPICLNVFCRISRISTLEPAADVNHGGKV